MKKIVVACIAILTLFNFYLLNQVNTLKEKLSTNQTVIKQTVTEFDTDFTKLVEKTSNKVVGVSSISSGRQIASGSGAIYQVNEKEVIIITNNHVISNGQEIEVLFANKEKVKAELVGGDLYTDLAVLRCYVDFDVVPFSMGDSSLTKVGEWSFAIGSPLGLDFYGSVTMGIISGKDRVIPVDLNNDGTDDWDMLVMQTDAAINPGNSGGPLINLAGELIGINSMKFSSSNVEGMGFAIPINEVVPIVNQLLENGEVIRPLIGISAYDVNQLPLYIRNSYGIQLDLEEGILITSVIENGAAELAGLKEGDIITKFDGEKVNSFKEFRKKLYTKAVGDLVDVTYIRNQISSTIKVKLQ